MKNNIFQIKFCELPQHAATMVEWKACIDQQLEIRKWCRETIHPEEGYPHWQLGGNYDHLVIPTVQDDYEDFVPVVYDSIYLKKESDRLAFLLRFPFTVWK